MEHEIIQSAFASNRAEELGPDVWAQYVILPSFSKLDIGQSQKPKVIVGGRGCGKTMLLRYLSHQSTFSPNRNHYPEDILNHIGLYWRTDTQFASLLNYRGKDEDTWRAAFGHLAALILSIEVLRSLESIDKSTLGILNTQQLTSLDFNQLKAFSNEFPSTYYELINHLENTLSKFEIWANNVHSVSEPLFLPGNKFIKRIIVLIKNQLPDLGKAVFSVYIDEYENLSLYQQRIVNTWLKHSEPPLVFNLAMKRNGFKVQETEGAEALSNIHDYRKIDLEDFDIESEFSPLAAEILLSRLQLAGIEIPELNPELLRDPSGLNTRQESNYKRNVINVAKSIFSSRTRKELASEIFDDQSLMQKLQERITQALKIRNESYRSPDEFISKAYPEASIIMPALLNRRKPVEHIYTEFQNLVSGIPNKFTGHSNWIHNNFVGCYLQLFDGLVRPCPLYGGFSTFCYISRGNLRHFLELCHQALNRDNYKQQLKITVEKQAEAARHVSASLLSEVRSFGSQGNNLHTFLLRLGSLFSLSQQSPSQSEPEKTHFSIKEGEASLDSEQAEFISEAVKWSVIFEEKGTKKKAGTDPEGIEYVLNPIYAPYFHISYRKLRKLVLPASDVKILINGEYNLVVKLLKNYQQKWHVTLNDAELPLFSHLDRDEAS